MKDIDHITDKTAKSLSLIASCFDVKKVKDGDTRDTDKFRVSIPVYKRGRRVGYQIVRHELKRKDFAKFMLRNRENVRHSPSVNRY